MRRLLFSALLLVATASLAAPPSARHLGFFTNQKTVGSNDDPHTEGYALDLYQEEQRVFGKFCVSTGIETPCGIIEDAKIRPSTGIITFRAKLSTGIEFTRDSGSQGRPSRDLFEFAGTISNDAVKGRITHRSGYDSASEVRRERVSLHRIHADTMPTNYANWAREPANKPVDW
ncbi:hypothetical protein [Ralstonia flaminis]|jgi:hypothetical protein|uniref:hypothetical protein n=1 Tax=Ralstonia flaminis TaxID=3058597 RepID=UPI00292CDAB4|nr:hypothetical protein [Ralstonia sp. LMG 18101]